MNIFNQILYWLTTGLLAPVIVILLYAFVRVMLQVGGTFSLYLSRLKTYKALGPHLESPDDAVALSKNHPALTQPQNLMEIFLQRIIEHKSNRLFCQKMLSDFEIECERELSAAKGLTKTGPILGLMGTLIPLGPALVGLAEGNIISMAQNLQVAFSTTVVGVLVGGVGYLVQLNKQRWFAQDLNNLEFIFESLNQSSENPTNNKGETHAWQPAAEKNG